MALQRPVRVSLPCVNDYTLFSLCVGDKVIIPTDVWEYAATTINKTEQKRVWLSDDLPPTITGVVRWLGTLPIVGDTQLFAGIQTDGPVVYINNRYPSGTYADQICFTCPEGHGVFLPVEYVVRHSKDIKETPTPAYPMNARPHGIALVIVIEEYRSGYKRKGAEFDTQNFISTFKHLQYTVQPYNKVTSSQMIQLVEEIASMDHTAYDSFVCCISSTGANNHYVQCSDSEVVNVYQLIDKIQQCPTLQGKPKLFFIAIDRHMTTAKTVPPASSHEIGPDSLIVWSTQKEKSNSLYRSSGTKFTIALSNILMLKSKSSTLLLMIDEVSAFVSMFPPRYSRRTCVLYGQCPEIESQLKKSVFFFREEEISDYAYLLNRALDEGYVTVKWTKLTLLGAPGTGKSSVLKLLLGEGPPDHHHSTSVITAPEVRKVEISGFIAGEDTQSWNKVDYESLKAMIAGTMKGGIKSGPLLELPDADNSSSLVEDSDDDFEDDDTIHDNSTCSPENPQFKKILSLPIPSSAAKEEVAQLLHTAPKSDELYNTHWIYAIDSGGQAAFLDIAPTLLRYNSVNLLTLKLNEKLQDRPKFYFSIRGKQIGEPVKRQITNLQLLETSFRSLSSVDPPNLRGIYKNCSHKQPHLIVLGTYYDKISECSESLDEKDATLWSSLERFDEIRLNYRESREKVIFPINAIGRDKEEIKMANLIRNRICQSYIEAEIPARWFLFQLDLDKLHKISNTTIISKSKCLEIGKALKMDRKDVEASLRYYHDLTIFLYFPKVLPNVVFLHPQPLFDKLSELISISFADAVDYLEERHIFLPPGAHRKLKDEGMFHQDLLISSLSSGFTEDFLAADFLKLLEDLLIVAPLHGEYFLPSVLPTKILENKMKGSFSQNVDPLVLTWEMKPLPQGILPALVVNLLSRKWSPLFDMNFLDSDAMIKYRNAISLRCVRQGGVVLLVDAIYWLEIYYSGHPSLCPVIRSAIYEGINIVVKKFQYKPIVSVPQERFHCTFHAAIDHLCRPDDEKQTLKCCKDRVSTAQLNSRQESWFLEIVPETGDITEVLQKVPDTEELLGLLADVEHKWDKIGTALKISGNNLIAAFRDNNDDRARLSSVLTSWKDSKSTPTTWETIIDVMETLECNSTKTKIQQFLKKQEVYSKYARMKDFVTNEAVPLDISTVLQKVPDPTDLLILLADVEDKWNKIGKALKVSQNVLTKAFQQDSDDDNGRLSLVLSSWIETKPTPTTWETIIDVMKTLKLQSTSDKIQEFLIKGEVHTKYANTEDFGSLHVIQDISTVLQKVPDTTDLLDLLVDVEDKWNKIGRALKVSQDVLIEAFQQDSDDDNARLSLVLSSWIETKPTSTTWETIIDVMKTLKLQSTSDKIQEFLSKEEVYSKYTDTEDFKSLHVIQDITAVLRKVPDTMDLLRLLSDVEHKWDKIGKELKVNKTVLAAAFLDCDDHRSRFSLVLRTWKDTKTTPATWETIIDVMKSLNHNSIANKIRQFLAKEEIYSKYTGSSTW